MMKNKADDAVRRTLRRERRTFRRGHSNNRRCPFGNLFGKLMAMVVLLLLATTASHHHGGVVQAQRTTTTAGPKEDDAAAAAASASSASSQPLSHDRDILERVTERLERIMGIPVQATLLLQSFHANQGFQGRDNGNKDISGGLHAASRDTVMTFLYSLIQSFHGLKIYIGTERGEYFAYFAVEAVYREPGNSGYVVHNNNNNTISNISSGTISNREEDEDDRQKYWSVCVNGETGIREPCQMAIEDSYVQCSDNQDSSTSEENQWAGECPTLIPCGSSDNSENSLSMDTTAAASVNEDDSSLVPEQATAATSVLWCRNYTIEKVAPTDQGVLGFIPASYHCIDEYGRFSQEPGRVLAKPSGEEGTGPVFSNGTCMYGNTSPVASVTTGPFAYCKSHGTTDNTNQSCNDTYTGMIRTVNYDPRLRPWYKNTKAQQRPNWSPPYPFHTHSDIITKIGITYAHPYYTTATEQDSETGEDTERKVFAGVFAVDYTLYDISTFLEETYGQTSTQREQPKKMPIVVTIVEAAPPHYLIGISTGTSPYRQVLESDETQPCPEDGQTCTTIRVPGTDITATAAKDDRTAKYNRMASLAIRTQAEAGFPSLTPIVAEEDIFGDELDHKKRMWKKDSTEFYLTQSVRYTQPGTGLEWIVLVASPLALSGSDAIQAGDVLFVSLILVAMIGVIGCTVLLVLWCRQKGEAAVMYGDFVFTSAFIIGCILLNLSSLVSLGDSTDFMCMTRFWTFHLSFSLALAPLLVKVYRVYSLVGAGGRMTRKTLTHHQAAMRMLPIVALEIIILLVFTIVDPPRATTDLDLTAIVPMQHISCKHKSDVFFYINTLYKVMLVLAGCVLSFYSRNLDARFGESKQLLFAMYNIAFTSICVLSLITFVRASPDAIHMFRTLGVLWGTVLTCAVFVVPRLLEVRGAGQGMQRKLSNVRISGLHGLPSQHMLMTKSCTSPSSWLSTPKGSVHILAEKSAKQSTRVQDPPFEDDVSIVFEAVMEQGTIAPEQAPRCYKQEDPNDVP